MVYIVHIVLTFLLTIHFSESITFTVNDVSKSNVCEKGVWHQQDRTELDIRVDMQNEPVTDSTTFIMELEDPVQGIARKVCLIYYKHECNKRYNITEGCFCKYETVQGNIYNIKYLSYSKSLYSNNIVWINGKKHPDVKVPYVASDKITAVVKVNNGQQVSTTSTNCRVPVTLSRASEVTIQFCPQGLNYPTLKEGDKNVEGDCISIVKSFSQEETTLTFDYQDKCKRTGSYRCTFQPIAGDIPSGPEADGPVDPGPVTSGPNAATLGPDAATLGPDAVTPEPDAVTPEPDAVTPEPGPVTMGPDDTTKSTSNFEILRIDVVLVIITFTGQLLVFN